MHAQGLWRSGSGRVVYKTKAEYTAAKAALVKLRQEAQDDKLKADELATQLKAHAEGHLDRILFGTLTIRIGTRNYIIDPMHALELNVGKVAWKWSFTNQMDDKGRDRTASFLSSIGLPIDLREKGKRERQMKWFSASSFDDFVLGKEHSSTSKSKSPRRQHLGGDQLRVPQRHCRG